MSLSQEDIEKYFTRKDGTYLCARWGRPIAPVIFGVDEASLEVFKAALEAVVVLADHKMAETDPELGSNLMIFSAKIGMSWRRCRTSTSWCRICRF